MKHLVLSAVILCTPAVSLAQDAPPEAASQAQAPPKAELTWQDNSNNETGFVVERRPQATPGAFTIIGQAGANVTTYTDTLALGDSVCYRVKAVNAAGSSTPSNEPCVTIPTPTPPTAPDGMTIKVIVEVTTGASSTAPQPAE